MVLVLVVFVDLDLGEKRGERLVVAVLGLFLVTRRPCFREGVVVKDGRLPDLYLRVPGADVGLFAVLRTAVLVELHCFNCTFLWFL